MGLGKQLKHNRPTDEVIQNTKQILNNTNTSLILDQTIKGSFTDSDNLEDYESNAYIAKGFIAVLITAARSYNAFHRGCHFFIAISTTSPIVAVKRVTCSTKHCGIFQV